MKRWIVVLLVAVVAVMMLAVGVLLGRRSQLAGSEASTSAGGAPATGKKVLYWYDPMVPQQHFDKPGLSPMGMQMVPKYAGASSDDPNAVQIDPSVEQNLGMRTQRVQVGMLQRHVRVSGAVAWDLREAQTLSARANGVVERLFVRAPYESVKAGQPLVALIAPQWNAAAQEYLALGHAHSAEARALRGAARERLRVLGMDEAQIEALHGGQTQIILRAPMDGVVSQLNIREGQQVSVGMPLMTINGLDSVWLDAALPQAQSAGIAAGTPITAQVSAMPGVTFHGRVEALLPDVDAMTRTQRARIVLDNVGHRLAPGMFAEVTFVGGMAGNKHPLVPDEALISTGEDTRVIVADGAGQFRPVAVTTGLSSDGMTEIMRGLHGGEHVVVSGQFLIDSEASLSGALQRLGQPSPSDRAASMPDMAMPEKGAEGWMPASTPSASNPPHGSPQASPGSMPGMTMPAPHPQEPSR